MGVKPIDIANLTPAHLERNPVWEFVNDMEATLPHECVVRPVVELPVATLGNRIVGVKVSLANSRTLVGFVSNVDIDDAYRTEHFLCVTLFNNGQRFDLARYHDFDYGNRGPIALGKFLSCEPSSVFPLRFDMTGIVAGESLSFVVPANPTTQLTQDELMQLAIQ